MNNSEIVLYDVFTKWCAPCRMMEPTLAKIEAKYGRVKVVRIDAEKENDGSYPNFDVRSVPCFIVVVDDIERGRKFGFQREEQIVAMFEPYL